MLRMARGVRQKDLAYALGRARSRIFNHETGRHDIWLRDVDAWAEYFGAYLALVPERPTIAVDLATTPTKELIAIRKLVSEELVRRTNEGIL